MAIHRRILVMLALVAAVAGGFAAGCSNSGDDNNPVAPSDTTQFTQQLAEIAGVGSAQSFGSVISGVPAIASGDISGGFGGLGRMIPGSSALADTAVYDPVAQAWVYGDTVIVSGSDSTRTAVDASAQFITEGVPHEDRTDWDTITALIDLDLFRRSHSGTITTDVTSSLYFEFNITHLVVDGTPAYNVLGDGYSDLTISTSIPTEDILPLHTYHFDLTNVREGSCPSGTITVTMSDYQLIATYNGTPTVSWDLHHPVGGAIVKSDTYTASCGGH